MGLIQIPGIEKGDKRVRVFSLNITKNGTLKANRGGNEPENGNVTENGNIPKNGIRMILKRDVEYPKNGSRTSHITKYLTKRGRAGQNGILCIMTPAQTTP